MDRLPTELIDRIIYYVGSFSDYNDSHIYSLRELDNWPASHNISRQAQSALAVLRLVDKVFCRSASRVLFRYITIRRDFGPTFLPWFETLASSEYALYVRYITFQLRPIPRERLRYVQLPEEVANRLPSLLLKFVNLKSIHIWPFGEDRQEKTIPMVALILNSIANLPLHNLTELGLMVGGTPYLHDLFGELNHDTPVTQLAQRIQHLHVIGDLNNMTGLNVLLKSTPNLCSLAIEGNWFTTKRLVHRKVTFGQTTPPLKFLDLAEIKISSNHLLALLEECKGSLRFLSLNAIELTAGSWMHILSQINKNLNLYMFLLTYDEPEEEEKEHWGPKEKLGLFHWLDEFKITWCLHGDIQRQISANRLAAGLGPLSNAMMDEYLSRPSLKSAMSEKDYQLLMSRSWDYEKHQNQW
ncbi:hypothetical protein ZTR_08942 [Talaromyces verruculosus]|nr:hypothetical protein ZTR_08942 [Talaromyces verruculosus]